jgi:muramoyltetrapeptide carboxypeptidase
MRKARPLRPGDRVAIVSPASPFSRDEFDRGVEELRRLGYEPVFHESIFDRSRFTSGPPELRAAAFVRAWSDPSVAALIAVRGGYGSIQLLPALEGWDPGQHPKLLIGYSDITTLLTWLTCLRGVAAVHGPMLEGRLAHGAEGYDESSFRQIVSGAGVGLELRPPGFETLTEGAAAGPLFGGTMTQLCASLGTPYAFSPPEGCVLFLEDVNERPYRIDRMLTQLQLAGILDRASGVVFGEMRGCEEPGGALTARHVAESLGEVFDGPVAYGFPSGHTSGPCWTLPLGVRVSLRASAASTTLVLEESPVA